MKFGSIVPRLTVGRLRDAEHDRRRVAVDFPPGATVEDALTPSYWAHYARTLRPKDIVEIMEETGAWEGQFRVMFTSNTEVKMAKSWVVDYDVDTEAIEPAVFDRYDLAWKGPVLKYAIMDKTSGAIVKDHLYPKGEAIAALKQHTQAVGA